MLHDSEMHSSPNYIRSLCSTTSSKTYHIKHGEITSDFQNSSANLQEVSCAAVRAIFLVSAYSVLVRLGINHDFDAPEPIVCYCDSAHKLNDSSRAHCSLITDFSVYQDFY